MQEFGERLRKLRQSKRITQDELGTIFDPPLAQSTIGTYERGLRQPTYENLVLIANYFNTSTDYLLGLTDEIEIKEEKQQDSKELREFLEQNNILFNGAELSEEDKKRMIDILTGLFWSNFINKK